MVPTLLLVGLVAGAVVQPHRRALPIWAAAAAFLCVGWGLLVAGGGTSGWLADVGGGAGLALVNLAVGAAVGLGARRAAHLVLRRPASRPSR